MATGPEIGRARCPGCGRQMTVRKDKNGRAYASCPWANEETLEPCATKVFFGKPATRDFEAKAERAAKKPAAPDRPEPAGADLSKSEGGDDDGTLF